MKRLLFMGVVVGLVATAANAASIGLRWQGTADQKIFAAPSDTVAVDVVLTVYATSSGQEQVSGVAFSNMPVAEDNLLQVGVTVDPDGDLADAGFSWNSGSVGGFLGAVGQQVNVFAGLAGDIVAAPGEYVIARQFLHLTGGEPFGANKEIFFNHAAGVDVFNGAGGSMAFDGIYSTYYYGSGGGFVGYNYFGNPGYSQKHGGQPTPNPLLLGKIPEPTSLALFALGGFALARRRR